jgi:hypothetical protein
MKKKQTTTATTRIQEFDHSHVGDGTILPAVHQNCAYSNGNRAAIEEHHRRGVVPVAKRALAAVILEIPEHEVRCAAFV